MKKTSTVLMLIAMTLGITSQANSEESEQRRPPRPSFESVDSDGNEEIDFDEFSLQELPRGDHQAVFSDIDENDDGIISYLEYQNHKPPHPRKHQPRSSDD